jgi:hypothetical protein
MHDTELTGGDNEMSISLELVSLGQFFASARMQNYGKEMLCSYLREIIKHIGGLKMRKRDQMKVDANFSSNFCRAVRTAFHLRAPVKPVQDTLADFTFAARTYLFKEKEFVSLIENKEEVEFGNLVLMSEIKGGITDAFKDTSTV